MIKTSRKVWVLFSIQSFHICFYSPLNACSLHAFKSRTLELSFSAGSLRETLPIFIY